MSRLNQLLGSLFTLWVLTGSPIVSAARAEDVPYWPSDQERRLSELDAQVLDTMRALSAARLRNESQEVDRLSKEFKTIQDERTTLLRAQGKLPPPPPQ
jgi:hypothetical protein